jgi:hypothetical protein
MKQKYLITNLQEKQEVSIREYAELEKGEFSFICEETYDADTLRAAMPDGAQNLIPIVRRPNMYPREDYSERISQGIIDLLSNETGETSKEINIDDADVFHASDTDLDPRVVYEEDGDTKAEKKEPA